MCISIYKFVEKEKKLTDGLSSPVYLITYTIVKQPNSEKNIVMSCSICVIS